MKIMAFMVMLFGISAFAFMEHGGSFAGKGTWKTDNGAKGTWTETLQVKTVEGTVEMNSHIKVFHQEELVEEKKVISHLKATQNGFFKIQVGDRLVGDGYCFRSLCHFQMNHEGAVFEETIHVEKTRMHKMGSSTGTEAGENYYVAWVGGLAKK